MVYSDFTQDEIDRFLGKKMSQHKINMIPKGENVIKIYSAEDFESFFGIHFTPSLHFPDKKTLKKVIRNCSIFYKWAFSGDELHNGANCVIKWVNDELGYGLYANEDLKKGAFIGEYTGQVRQISRLKPELNAYCFHYPTIFWSWNYFIIDALYEGNETRFINHNDQPNLIPSCIVNRNLVHIYFHTNDRILKGTELTFNYGKDYWKLRKKWYNK